jgi:hypothetical protein
MGQDEASQESERKGCAAFDEFLFWARSVHLPLWLTMVSTIAAAMSACGSCRSSNAARNMLQSQKAQQRPYFVIRYEFPEQEYDYQSLKPGEKYFVKIKVNNAGTHPARRIHLRRIDLSSDFNKTSTTEEMPAGDIPVGDSFVVLIDISKYVAVPAHIFVILLRYRDAMTDEEKVQGPLYLRWRGTMDGKLDRELRLISVADAEQVLNKHGNEIQHFLRVRN